MARIKAKKEIIETPELESTALDEVFNEEESATASFTRKRGLGSTEPKQMVKVEIPEGLSKEVHQGLLTLEERGLKRTASDFVQSCLQGINETHVAQWVEKETPVEWRVNECLKDPEKSKLMRKLFDLDSSKNAQTLKALEQIFEKKDKGARSPLKKKKKVVLPSAVTEASAVHKEPESALLS